MTNTVEGSETVLKAVEQTLETLKGSYTTFNRNGFNF